jgi:hypothetical protein
MVFSRSGFIGCCEEFARLHCRQSLQAGRKRCGQARAEQAGLGDAGDGDGIGLVAAKHVEMRDVLPDREADMTARPAFEDQHRASDWLDRLTEQQPVSRPLGIDPQRS